MENATEQEWYPEWLFTGTVYQDLALLARLPRRAVGARVRDVDRVAVGAPRPDARAAAEVIDRVDESAQLVLG